MGTNPVVGTRTGGEQLACRIEVVYYTFSAIKSRSVRRRLFPNRSFHALFSDLAIFSSPFVLVFFVGFFYLWVFFLFRADNSPLTQNMRVDNKSIFDFQTITATRRPWDVLSWGELCTFVGWRWWRLTLINRRRKRNAPLFAWKQHWKNTYVCHRNLDESMQIHIDMILDEHYVSRCCCRVDSKFEIKNRTPPHSDNIITFSRLRTLRAIHNGFVKKCVKIVFEFVQAT